MSILAVEGIVSEIGQIQLSEQVELLPKTKVYVIVPGMMAEASLLEKIEIYSPRLRHRQDVAEFALVRVKEETDGSV